MPIYEFYCDNCNVIFNFYSSRVNTAKQPSCPRCHKENLERQMSTFATIGKAKEMEDGIPEGFDEARMEKAFMSLMQEAENVNEDDPRQMAALMRKFTDKTGIQLGDSMEEALGRMEAGEDPELIEKEMADKLDGDDISFSMLKKKAGGRKAPPEHDESLYDL